MSVSGLFGCICTMTARYLNKCFMCKHTERLLYTKPCWLVLRLRLAQHRGPAMATYGGVSINKHLGLSPVTRTPRLTHTHTLLRHTITAADFGRGYTETIGEFKESLGLVYCSWESSLLTNTFFKFSVRCLALAPLFKCLMSKKRPQCSEREKKTHLSRASHAKNWCCWD